MKYLADRIAVMRHGKIIEINDTSKIFTSPSQEYTKKLIDAIPLADPKKEIERQGLIMKGI